MKPGKNFLLNIEDSYDEFFEDTSLIGIVSSNKSHKFCLQVNRILQFDFRLNRDIEIVLHKKDRKYFFPVYQSNVKHSNFVKHYLYSNRHDGEVLLPEFKHIDFIWLIKGATALEEQMQNIVMAVKSMQGIQLATQINPSALTNKEYLIF